MGSIGAGPVHVRTSGAEGLDLARSERPDLVLLDIGLPDWDGIELGRTILAELPESKVVALTGLHDPRLVREAVAAGFHGFLSKDLRGSSFGRSILRVMDGEIVVPGRDGKEASHWSGYGASDEVSLLASQLTPRELEVLGLLARGADSRQMSSELGVRVNTVRTHIHSILSKLGVSSRLEAAAFAVRNGLVRLPWIA
ncbi:MAG: response regulator [Candidatus Velamenicoccus archaeovorus]